MIKKIVKKVIIKIIGFVHFFTGTKNIIIFKGYGDLDGNAYALYDYLSKDQRGEKYKFVWLVENYKEYKKTDKVDYVSREKPLLKNLYYRACGKYLFWDHGYVDGFDYIEKVIYLGHGNPAMKNTSTMIRINETPTDLALTTSEKSRKHTSEMINFPEDKLFVCGLPRNDIIFNQQCKWNEILNIDNAKVVLWMPTFRKANDGVRNDSNQDYLYGLPLIHTDNDLMTLNCLLHELNLCIVIKLHPFAEALVKKDLRYSNIVFMNDEMLKRKSKNVYYFFNDSAALLTDYSSVVFDFMLADRPIGYIVDDIDDYKLGFPFENILDYMPGSHIYSMSQLVEFLKDIAEGKDEKANERHVLSKWANDYPSGDNCKRVADILNI